MTTPVLFLDAGGVILDEADLEAAKAELLTQVISATVPYSLDQYWSDTDEAVFRFVPSTYDYLLFKNLGPGFEPAKIEFQRLWAGEARPLRLMNGLREWTAQISRSHRLGILGQYGPELIELLDREGLLPFFTYRNTQEEFRLTKPDPRYFEAVVARAGLRPDQCIMVGDRIDKDIIPAKQVGMKTIRMRTGIHRHQEPRTPSEVPGLTVDALEEITTQALDSLHN